MLTANPEGSTLLVPLDIYRRASVRDFVDLVNSEIPTLALSVDRAVSIAYLLALHEARGLGVQARAAGEEWGFSFEDLTALLAAAYATFLPALDPRHPIIEISTGLAGRRD